MAPIFLELSTGTRIPTPHESVDEARQELDLAEPPKVWGAILEESGEMRAAFRLSEVVAVIREEPPEAATVNLGDLPNQVWQAANEAGADPALADKIAAKLEARLGG